MIEESTVSTPEGCTANSLMTPNLSVSIENNIVRTSLRQFTEKLDVKQKTSVFRFGIAKSNCKAIKKVMCCGQTFQSASVIQK